MDATAAIEHNLQALKRILAGLVAMAGLSLPLALSAASAREPGKTLPRHLHRAILRLLRPAESAARRLIVATAGGMVVALPPARKPKPKQPSADPMLRRLGIAVVVPPSDLRGVVPLVRTGSMRSGKTGEAGAPRIPCLPLFDPPRRLLPRRRTVPARSAPRILLPGFSSPAPRLPLSSPHDPIETTRLGLRLAALAAALDDLPRQARRLARWKARSDAGRQTPRSLKRTSPLRPGRPPGGRRTPYDPSARRSCNVREIDEVLAHAHVLALYALRRPDTS